jgi:hypothetical protein
MTSLFDKLNLRPGERRLVVIAAGVVFVFLNLLLVFPHFGDLGRVQQQARDAQITLNKFQDKIRREPDLRKQMQALAQQGAVVAEASRALELQREVTSQALLCGVPVVRAENLRNTSTRTNTFFDEQSVVITVSTGEKELICFLYSLAERNSLIRVRSMHIQPEPPNRYKLQGNITLVASYQRQAPSKPSSTSTSPAQTPPPAPTPAATRPPAATTPPTPTAAPKPPTLSKPVPPSMQKVPSSPPEPATPAAAPPPRPTPIPTRMQPPPAPARPSPQRPAPPLPPPGS